MISNEDRADVKRAMGGGVAKKVATATNDAKSKALIKKADRNQDYKHKAYEDARSVIDSKKDAFNTLLWNPPSRRETRRIKRRFFTEDSK